MNFKKCLRLGPAEPREFQASKGYRVRSCLNDNNKNLKSSRLAKRGGGAVKMLLSDNLS